MQELISKKIQELEDVELPDGLHGRIVRQLLFLQFRTPFTIVVSLLIVNLLVSGWHIWVRVSENNAIEVLRIIIASFEFSSSYLSNVMQTVTDLFPISLIASFILNLALVTYVTLAVRTIKNAGRARS